MNGFETENCVVCRRRITDAGWLPFCCEVCWDSADAAERRLWETYRIAGPDPNRVRRAREHYANADTTPELEQAMEDGAARWEDGLPADDAHTSRYRTETGFPLTEALIEQYAKEAEEGYDPELLLPRRTAQNNYPKHDVSE